MKAAAFLFAILLLCLSTWAQPSADQTQPQLQWSHKVRVKPKDLSTYNLINVVDNNALVLGRSAALISRKINLTIHRFNESLVLNKESEFDNTFNDGFLYLETVVAIGENTFLLSATNGVGANKDANILYAQKLNPKTLRPERDAIKLAEINTEDYSRFNNGSFDVTPSADSTALLIFYSLPSNREENEKFGFKIVDTEFQEVWGRETELPYENKLTDVVNTAVNSDGDVYVLVKVFEEKRKEIRRGEINYSYDLLIYPKDSEGVVVKNISNGDKSIPTVSMFVTRDGHVSLSGLYSEDESSESNGIFHMKLDGITGETLYISNRSYVDAANQYLNDDRLNKKMERRESQDRDLTLHNFYPRAAIPTEEGGFYFLTENFYTHSYSYTNNNGISVTRTTHLALDIMVVRIDSVGEIEWWTTVRKGQSTGHFQYIKYLSFIPFYYNGILHLIYNDNKNNTTERIGETTFGYSGGRPGIVQLVTIDNQGNVTKTPLSNWRESKVSVVPSSIVRMTDNELYLLGSRLVAYYYFIYVSNYKIGKLTLH